MEFSAVIVDDDPHVLSLAGRWLRQAGCHAVMSRSFADAQTQIVVFEPTILIADVRLGDFNGIQLGHLAQRIRGDVRILIISGWDDCVLRREAERLGATFLAKPFTAAALLSAVGLSPDRPQRQNVSIRPH
jgi:FixJ family two-component response regulator